MISLLFATLFFLWLVRAALHRPAFLLVGAFLLWQFLLKVIGVVYLDIAGPVYSDEVATAVGGSGASALPMLLFAWLPLALLYWVLRPVAKAPAPQPEPHLAQGGITLADAVTAVLWLLVGAMYIDLLIRGNIPLLTGTERFEYQGGMFHVFFLKFIFLITFVLGYVFARGRLILGTWDLRCIALLFTFFIYLLLTGHRFGAFYVMASFMALALAGLYLAKAQGWPIAPPVKSVSWIQTFMHSRLFIVLIGGGAVALVLFAMVHSLFVVRDYGAAAGDELFQRLFVQPVHLYWLTWDELQRGLLSTRDAFDFIFQNPLDPNRNPGIQYMMYLHMGAQRAATVILDQSTDYAGGYPEVVMALSGIGWGALVALLVSWITACIYRLILTAVCRGHFLTAVCAVYVCYGLLTFYLGGNITFFLTWTYWVKIGLLAAAIVLDRTLSAQGKRFLPWVLIPRKPGLARTHAVTH